MDINVLVLNVGNSRLAMGVFAGGELQQVRRVDLDDRANLPGIVKELWNIIARTEGAGGRRGERQSKSDGSHRAHRPRGHRQAGAVGRQGPRPAD